MQNVCGPLLKRRCSSVEASALLQAALSVDCSSGISSHSLKATTLVWCGRRGFSERDSLLLGHHSTGRRSHAVYARDMLSAPLRLYCAMLQEIKQGHFKPDATRSGRLNPSSSVKPVSHEFGLEPMIYTTSKSQVVDDRRPLAEATFAQEVWMLARLPELERNTKP